MLFAWYGHLKYFNDKPMYIIILISWCIALIEYIFMIPANTMGSKIYSLAQLKIMQEAITLSMFIPFSILIMNQPIKMDYIYASICIGLGVYFIFRT